MNPEFTVKFIKEARGRAFQLIDQAMEKRDKLGKNEHDINNMKQRIINMEGFLKIGLRDNKNYDPVAFLAQRIRDTPKTIENTLKGKPRGLIAMRQAEARVSIESFAVALGILDQVIEKTKDFGPLK